MIEIQPGNTVITSFFPSAKDETQTKKRYRDGIDKLYNTSDAERVSIYEASLIRYFEPPYNKEFVNSFPSTNLKILEDRYKKDFASVVSEICFDDIQFNFYSKKAPAKSHHIAHFDLHKEEDRRMFFLNR